MENTARPGIDMGMRRRASITDELRQRIRSGRYPVGTRIPTRRELGQELGVSPVTLQRAVDRLTELGFLVARGRQGTFIATQPPDLTRCAVVFGDEPGKGGWNRFWTTFQRETAAWRDAAGRRFEQYFISNASQGSRAHRRLCADLADEGLAGIFFVSPPFFLAGSPITSTTVPTVCVGEGLPQGSVASIADPLPMVVQRFAAAGRRRLGVICTKGLAESRRRLVAEVRRQGVETREEWWIGLPIEAAHAECARSVAQLLLSGRPNERPDCLLVNDDNLVPHATAGIIDVGLRVPEDLLVCAHANFPHATPSAVVCT
ncbi:MAG: GntR family transcriptional regulator, partial [Planctomycetes bacterium]|nr:GntR family transcriptional regulator [Planctomycetota bacterium]